MPLILCALLVQPAYPKVLQVQLGARHHAHGSRLLEEKGMEPDVMHSRQALLNCGAYHGYGDGCNGGAVYDI